MKKMVAGVAILVLIGQVFVGAHPTPTDDSDSLPSGIVWYGVLADGIAEAKATGKPIMLLSAAPQCAGVPGMW